MIKRRFAVIFVSIIIDLLVLLPVKAQENKELVVAIDTAFIPFEFKQGEHYVGFNIDLWEAIAKELKFPYRLRPMDFNGIVPSLQTKNINVALAGVTIRPDRKSVVDFSEPYYQSNLSILINEKTADIKGPDDLNSKTVAAKIGTAAVDFLQKQVPDAKLTLFPNIDNAYLELATGRVDAVVHDTPNIKYYAGSIGKGRVKIVTTLKSSECYGIAFPKGSPLVSQVNSALRIIHGNGVYHEIYKKWFIEKL